jgi:pyridoxal phosphate enzyme (YggS family)
MSRKFEIKENLEKVSEKIATAALKAGRYPTEINLIVVTKTFGIEDLEILYELGIREFGENRDQEASKKVVLLPKDINWHFQGQIQSNKLRSICTWARYIHSIDQLKHARIISESSQLSPKSIFIQVSLDSPPESRGGVDPNKLVELAKNLSQLSGIKILGLMAVAPVESHGDEDFERLQSIHTVFLREFPTAKYLSAGMSGDYERAILFGATHLRIGSSILGKRMPNL